VALHTVPVEDYRFLWDGSEPGWILVHMSRQTVKLSLVFGDKGPDLRQVKAIRKAVLAYAALPASEALASLRGHSSIDLGEFESREARSLARDCRDIDLVVQEQVIDHSGYSLFNEKNKVCLLIQDDALAKQVCEEALSRKLPVQYIEA
jgi:hypothetical protein